MSKQSLPLRGGEPEARTIALPGSRPVPAHSPVPGGRPAMQPNRVEAKQGRAAWGPTAISQLRECSEPLFGGSGFTPLNPRHHVRSVGF